MSQGLDVEQGARRGGQTASVVQEVSRDDGHSSVATDSTVAAGVIQDNAFFYPSSALTSQRSNACEILIRALDIIGAVTFFLWQCL